MHSGDIEYLKNVPRSVFINWQASRNFGYANLGTIRKKSKFSCQRVKVESFFDITFFMYISMEYM